MNAWDEQETGTAVTLARITLPPIPRASVEEIERRRALFREAMALRDEIGPIGVSAADLVRQVRDESDGL